MSDATKPGTELPDEAVEAFRDALYKQTRADGDTDGYVSDRYAGGMYRIDGLFNLPAALNAALPLLAEHWATDAQALKAGMLGNSQFAHGYRTACNDFASRLVRGLGGDT